jgi:hypothetical protein
MGEEFTPEAVARETRILVMVANADGSDARTVASVKVKNVAELPFEGIDWR